MLSGKNILLGVSSSIAAYKALDIVSKLLKLNANVDVIMTKNATEFISPTSFESLSKNRVVSSVFDGEVGDISHISLSKKADLFVIAPATANIMAKIACGIADDIITSTVLAYDKNVLIAPAMNTKMLENKATLANIKLLKSRGFLFVESKEGVLACGDSGKGKLADTDVIVDRIVREIASHKDFEGKKVLVTAGATREHIDPVRFLSNPSTGKMGYSIARELSNRGAEVVLVSGKTNLDASFDCELVPVTSALDMYEVVMDRVDGIDAAVFTAAVADYRPKTVAEHKIKKTDGDMCIELERNPDIAKSVGDLKLDIATVGFSVETEHVIDNSTKKLEKKGFDFIVCNDVSKSGAGFAVDTNIVSIIDRKNVTNYDMMPKSRLAEIVADKLLDVLEKK